METGDMVGMFGEQARLDGLEVPLELARDWVAEIGGYGWYPRLGGD